MPISITQQPIVMNVSTSPARLSQSGNGAKTLNLDIKELTESEKKLKEAVIEKKSGDVKAILHKLKGTAGTAGLLKLVEYAANWETKIDENNDYCSMQEEIISEISRGLHLIKKLEN